MKRILTVPLFPLPRTVLFPGVMLPFYVFEPRYRAMLAEVVDGAGLIGIPLIVPGFEGGASGSPPITKIFGVGSVEHYAMHEDGTSDIHVLGRHRVQLLEELPPAEFRRARVTILDDANGAEEVFAPTRRRLNESLTQLSRHAVEGDLGELLQRIVSESPEAACTVNILATLVVASVEVRQTLLEEDDVTSRALHLTVMIESLTQELEARRDERGPSGARP